MTASLMLLATLAAVGGSGDSPRLFRVGGSPANGLLVNLSPGARPFDPPDPRLPSVVFVHGFNPVPGALRFTMAEGLAEALTRRGGPARNVLSWEWNASTYVSASLRTNLENNVAQGGMLAGALRGRGLAAGRTHLIGQSAGAIVATSAARTWLAAGGEPVAQLTLLDPAIHYHELVFERLGAGSVSPRVENYWAPGVSGFGREVRAPGVWNYRVDEALGRRGGGLATRNAHFNLVRWYYTTATDRTSRVGYNVSVSGLEG